MSANLTPDARAADAAARKAEAEARAAELAAERAALENDEWASQIAAEGRRAEALKEIAEAEKAANDAKTAQVSSLIPDFSKIERGSTTIEGDSAIYGSYLAHVATENAAKKLVDELPAPASATKILVTTDPDLASSDAIHLEVMSGMKLLVEAADRLTGSPGLPPGGHGLMPATAIVGAVAAAVPGLLSLFAADRTLTTFTQQPDTRAAAAEVLAALLAKGKMEPTLDDFRLVPGTETVKAESTLRTKRSEVVKHLLEHEEERSVALQDKAAASSEVIRLTNVLAKLPSNDPKRPDLEDALKSAEAKVVTAENKAREAAVQAGAAEKLISIIDGFLTAIHAVPTGSKRSPFAIAALREQLHADPPEFAKVLFLESAPGSVTQLVNDLPLWFKDKLHSLGSMSIKYWLMDSASSEIEAAGVASGAAQIKGTIGKNLTLVTGIKVEGP